jgi:hypothetical protein
LLRLPRGPAGVRLWPWRWLDYNAEHVRSRLWLRNTLIAAASQARAFVVPAERDPIILEVNTLPGMTPTSLYPDAARAGGFPLEKLVAYLVERVLRRRL